MGPKMDPKIMQNARKARLRLGTLPVCILGSFLVDFGGRFGALFGSILTWFSTILANMHKYAQIQAQRRKDAQNTCKCGQILANTRRYTQIRANTSRYTHIRANTRKYMQTRPNTHRYTDAHRKDTANSHEQLQGAPFSSVRRHVPASLIIITRFPFTYQTGFQRGSKKWLFFCINFCIDFGVDLGSYFGQKFDDFQRLLAFIFWL